MSAPVVSTAAAGRPQSVLELYRDDGPLARALGGALGARAALPPLALVAAGAAPLLALLALGGDDVALPAVAAAVAWLVLAGALSQGRPHDDRFAWGVPVLLRLVEYAGLLWFAALAGASAVPAAFALLTALAFRHYDVVYRLRYQGVAPPRWLEVAAGGWDGRLLLGFGLLAAGALPAGLFVAAALLAVVLVGESIVGWMRFERAQRPPLYSDEEDENQ
jgi:hypothetical protein